jgi:hypothetical protein
MSENEDWLFPNAAKDKEVSAVRALQIAQLYLCFERDENARKLLTMWTAKVRNLRVNLGATAQEYAAHNAVREFVEGIYQQIELAKNRGNLP